EPGVLVDCRALPRGARENDPGLLAFGNRVRLEEGRRLVENRYVPELVHVACEHIGQPEVGIASLGPLAETGSPVRRAMPPFEHVAFAKLLGGVQHDLGAGEERFEQDQREDVLQLIAIAGGPAALVWAKPSE